MAERDDSDDSEPIEIPYACSAVDNNNCYILHLGDSPPSHNINVYNFESNRWHIVETLVSGRADFVGRGTCCSVIKDSLYVFGGWICYERREANIHELNLNDHKWRTINPTNPEEGPLCKGGAGMVDYGEEMLCVMGGCGPPPVVKNFQWQQGAAYMKSDNLIMTNELHIFHINLGEKKYSVFTNFNLLIICICSIGNIQWYFWFGYHRK